MGFVIGCICGIGLPFLLRLSPRATAAIEPFIMASQGIPKYALTPWLILWFGIGDAPKVIVVTLFVFYITFITVFAGIRGVDQRLVNMARIIGASERTIARKVIWISLLPFFFTGLKIALPRAVSAAIVGEFLVAVEGVGFSIERARQLVRHHRRVRRHRRRGDAGADHQRGGQCAGAPRAEVAADRPGHAVVRSA